MDQNDLVNILYEKQEGRITKIHLNEILDQLFQTIGESLKDGKEIQIYNFGSFSSPSYIYKPLASVIKEHSK
jgi:nucleoid DNA-binding protein